MEKVATKQQFAFMKSGQLRQLIFFFPLSSQRCADV